MGQDRTTNTSSFLLSKWKGVITHLFSHNLNNNNREVRDLGCYFYFILFLFYFIVLTFCDLQIIFLSLISFNLISFNLYRRVKWTLIIAFYR